MYINHPAFETSCDDSTKIWRYMDFTKFISILDSKSLFFCRADKLPDSFEGSSAKVDVERRQNQYKYLGDLCDERLKNYSESCKKDRKYVHINCWHINNYESAAMWKLYLKTNEGIAIQTTIERLKHSFDEIEENIFIGDIKYIDYDSDTIRNDNAFYPYLHKRKSFEYEKELRAVYYALKIIKVPNQVRYDCEEVDEMGSYIPVNLSILIDKIYVSPTAPKWFYDLIKSVLERYNVTKTVLQSSLANDPIY